MRIFTLILLLVALAAPSSANEILVLVDGSRMEVLSYEVRGNVVIITTLEGKLRSLPGTYVDVETSERLRSGSSPVPPAESPPKKDEIPRADTRPPSSPGETLSNLDDPTKARKALDLYGVEELFTLMHAGMVQGLTESVGASPNALYDEIKNAFTEGFGPEHMMKRASVALARGMDTGLLDSWLEWLETSPVRRIVELENVSGSASEGDRTAFLEEMKLTPPSSHRQRLIWRLDDAIGGSETLRRVLLAALSAMQPHLSALPVIGETQQRTIESLRESQPDPSGNQARYAGMSFTYRELGDVELESYVSYWESETGRRIHEALSTALTEAYREGGDTTGRALAEVAERNMKLLAQGQGQPVQPHEYEELNFRYTPPGNGWVAFDVSKLNPDATAAFLRQKPRTAFMIIAESIGVVGLTNEGAAEIVVANLKGASRNYNFISQEPYAVRDMEGILLVSEASLAGFDALYVQWVYVRHGFLYQLSAYVAKGELDLETLQNDAKTLFSGFELIDPSRLSVPDTYQATESFQSERYGYSMELLGSAWSQWETLDQDLPDADFGGLYGTTGAFVVVPVYLADYEPPLEILAKALMTLLSIDWEDAGIRNRRTLERHGRQGYSLDLVRSTDGVPFDYRIQVWQGIHFGHMVAVWVAKQDDTSPLLDDLLDRFDFDPNHDFDPSTMGSGEDNKTTAAIYNEIGIEYYRQNQFGKSAEILEVASRFDPDDLAVFQNLLAALNLSGRYEEGLKLLEEREHFSGDLATRSYRPYFLAQLGRRDEALAEYSALFGDGYRNDPDLQDYVELLWEMDRKEEALAVVETYREDQSSLMVTRLEALLHRRLENYSRAIEILEEARSSASADLDLAVDLLDAYYKAERYSDSVAVAEGLLAKGHDSSAIRFGKGRAELALGWYPRAKASFQSALDTNPSDEDVREYLDYVSGLLGEGDHEAIRRPIAPVAIPGDLHRRDPERLLNDADGEDHGAYYERRFTAISYRKNKEYRRTEHLRIRVLDQRGISLFSSFEFSFDPVIERMYVNELRVLDKSWKEIARGEAKDYFVRDETSEGMATQDQILSIPVAGLELGCTIELTVTWQRKAPPEKMTFLRHSFSSGVPVEKSLVYLSGDTEEVFDQASPGVKRQARENAVVWSVHHPPVFRNESHADAIENYLPFLWIGDRGDSWEALAIGYLDDIEDRLTLDSETRNLADSLVIGVKDPNGRVKAVAEYVQRAITYKAIEFGRRAWLPNRSADIINNKYGDCKDHALLFHQLLRVLNVPSHLALVGLSSEIQVDVPSLSQFNHMVVYLPSGDDGRFFDLTDKDYDATTLPPMGLGGKQALLLDPEKPRLVRIPPYPANSSVVRSERRVTAVENSHLQVQETLTLDGYYGAFLRGYLKSADSDGRKQIIQQYISGNGSAVVQEVSVDQLEWPSQSLVLVLSYRLNEALQQTESKLVGRIPALWERALIGLNPIPERHTPFRIYYPLTFTSEVVFVAPRESRILSPSISDDGVQQPSGDWNVRVSAHPEGIALSYSNRRSSYGGEASEYASYSASVQHSLEALEQSLILAPIQ